MSTNTKSAKKNMKKNHSTPSNPFDAFVDHKEVMFSSNDHPIPDNSTHHQEHVKVHSYKNVAKRSMTKEKERNSHVPVICPPSLITTPPIPSHSNSLVKFTDEQLAAEMMRRQFNAVPQNPVSVNVPGGHYLIEDVTSSFPRNPVNGTGGKTRIFRNPLPKQEHNYHNKHKTFSDTNRRIPDEDKNSLMIKFYLLKNNNNESNYRKEVHVSDSDVRSHFEKYGEIVFFSLTTKGYFIIEFAERSSLNNAYNSIQENDSEVKIRHGDVDKIYHAVCNRIKRFIHLDRLSTDNEQKSREINSLYFKFATLNGRDLFIDQENLRSYLEKFGPISYLGTTKGGKIIVEFEDKDLYQTVFDKIKEQDFKISLPVSEKSEKTYKVYIKKIARRSKETNITNNKDNDELVQIVHRPENENSDTEAN